MTQNGTGLAADERLPRLIAERERYQQWLDNLEAERAELPDHVYERIAADYAERLDKAVTALRKHLESLEARLDERRAALDEAVEELAARQDELLETRTRHRIGEIDEKHWQATEKALTQAIQEAQTRRDTIEAEVRRLEETIAQVREPVVAGAGLGGTAFLQSLAEVSANGGAASMNGTRRRTEERAEEPDPAPTRPRRPTGHRTRRCDTCGTFNLSDALFCEACGGDLPAS